MADNYLERKMEQYRSGKPLYKSYRQASLALHGKSAFIIHNDAVTIKDRLARLVRLGAKVAFTHRDMNQGAAIAQWTGAQFHPLMPPTDEAAMSKSAAIMARRWKGPGVVVCFMPEYETPAKRIFQQSEVIVLSAGQELSTDLFL